MAKKLNPRIGGSFAPPLTDSKISQYKSLIESQTSGPLKDSLTTLLKCCEHWYNIPESEGTQVRDHPSGVGNIVPLDEVSMEALDDDIPWEHELNAIQGLCDAIPVSEKELRDAAFHLLWHVKELNLDREPLTADKL